LALVILRGSIVLRAPSRRTALARLAIGNSHHA
jgi:hypothetical protein